MTTSSDPSRPRGRAEPPTIAIAQLDRDPHGIFRLHRLVTPFIRRDDDSYIAIRYGEVERLATDRRTRQVETERLRSWGITKGALFELFANTMVFSNGATHRRRRAPLTRAFAFRLIAELRPRIRAIAHQLLDRVEAHGEMDLVEDFAALFPAHIIGEILGLSEPDTPELTAWVRCIGRAFSFSFTQDELPEIEAAARNLDAHVVGLLEDRRARPRGDFLSSYAMEARAEGNLSPAETLAQIVTVILAGGNTTRAAMAVQVALLLQHEEQWEALCRDRSLIPAAVSESLRFEPAVASTARFTLTNIEIGGFVVPAGRVLSLSTLSAMRDPALYNDPDSFNIRRMDHPRRHLVFGSGPHRCLGEVLARAELEEGLAALLERFPRLRRLGEPLQMLGHAGIRRVGAVRVGWCR